MKSADDGRSRRTTIVPKKSTENEITVKEKTKNDYFDEEFGRKSIHVNFGPNVATE